MEALQTIFDKARQSRRHIVLPEGDDVRIQMAARRVVDDGLADITLLGDPDRIRTSLHEVGLHTGGISLVAPDDEASSQTLADAYYDLRKHKGVTREQAPERVRDQLIQAALRVRLGMADGTVGGAVATTADTIRASLQMIGRAPDVMAVSSFFLMVAAAEHPVVKDGMIFADCGLLVEPDSEELAAIALASAQSCHTLLGETPRIALLSFSTAGSSDHHSLEKIRTAVERVRERAPTLEIDGEIQFDAAFDAAIRAKKAPESRLSGRPNIFVFPDLASGNIGYKIAQRIGGMHAIGPILQGLAKPANDLSRGCTVNEIVSAIAVTSVQASHR